MILFRYIALRTFIAFLGSLSGVLLIFLAVDFVDYAPAVGVTGWFWPALELYANKSALVVHEIAPAAMIIGAALATSGLRQSREWTAMRALGLGPWRVGVPVAVVAVASGLALVLLHEEVGVHAAERVDELRAERFGGANEKHRIETDRAPKRWFRGLNGRRIYHLRGILEGGGFERVTILELTPEFRLFRRIDAERMRPDGNGWILEDAEERDFHPDGTLGIQHDAVRRMYFEEKPEAFAVLPGRPSQMPFRTLVKQIGVRLRTGLPVNEFELERYSRLAYPFAGLPGALLAVALSLRRERRGHVASALLESVAVTFAFWGAQGVSVALGLSGTVPPPLAAWVPDGAFLLAGLIAIRRVG